jgi:transcription antitermination factor NusG
MSEPRWYVLRSHPHQEEALARELEARHIEVFFPRLRVNPVNPRARKVRPYFPGYLFIHANLETIGASYFQWMPYASGLVSFSDLPPSVPDKLILALKNRLAEIDTAGGEILDALRSNQLVAIESGPFAGYEAVFDVRIPGSARVRVLLRMLNARQVPLELNAGQIRPIQARKKGAK